MATVELQDYLNVIRKRWMIIAAVALVTLGLAAAYTALTPRTYAATTQFYVSTSGDDSASSLQQGNTFSQSIPAFAWVNSGPQSMQASA